MGIWWIFCPCTHIKTFWIIFFCQKLFTSWFFTFFQPKTYWFPDFSPSFSQKPVDFLIFHLFSAKNLFISLFFTFFQPAQIYRNAQIGAFSEQISHLLRYLSLAQIIWATKGSGRGTNLIQDSKKKIGRRGGETGLVFRLYEDERGRGWTTLFSECLSGKAGNTFQLAANWRSVSVLSRQQS